MTQEDDVLSNIDGDKDNLVRMMQEVIRINTVNPPGNEGRVAEYMKPVLEELGFGTRIVEAEKGRGNIIATLPGKTGAPRLCMFAHTDTVPVGDPSLWRVDPFSGTVIDDKIFGRGASDHKFPMPALTGAVKAIHAVGVELHGDLICAFTADEERGSRVGMKYVVENGLLQGDYGVYVAPTGASRESRAFAPWLAGENIVVASNGLVSCRILVKGRTSHTAFLERGVNSIYTAARLIQHLEELAREVNTRTDPDTGRPRMSVNMISGGEGETQVPSRCQMVIDRSIAPSESATRAEDEIRETIEVAKGLDPLLEVDAEFIEGMPAVSLSRDSYLVKVIASAASRVTGREPRAVGLPAGMDMAWFAARTGSPCAAFGYGDIFTAHGPNEFIGVSDLVNSAKVCALIIMQILAKPG